MSYLLSHITVSASKPLSLILSPPSPFLSCIPPVTFHSPLKTSSEWRTRWLSLVMALGEGCRGHAVSHVREHQGLALVTTILAVQRPFSACVLFLRSAPELRFWDKWASGWVWIFPENGLSWEERRDRESLCSFNILFPRLCGHAQVEYLRQGQALRLLGRQSCHHALLSLWHPSTPWL